MGMMYLLRLRTMGATPVRRKTDYVEQSVETAVDKTPVSASASMGGRAPRERLSRAPRRRGPGPADQVVMVTYAVSQVSQYQLSGAEDDRPR